MANEQRYTGNYTTYENKLARVMERFGVEKYDFNWDRHGCFVQFTYKGELYRFDHSVENANTRIKMLGLKDKPLRTGLDSFAQLVLALQDLAKLVERGIYDLQTWVRGMKFLPPAATVPECFTALGFDSVPADALEVDTRYKELAKKAHPDAGGSDKDFISLTESAKQCKQHFNKVGVR